MENAGVASDGVEDLGGFSTSQKHGKLWENSIKASFGSASDNSRSNISEFDIEAKFDKSRRLPTSIKVAKDKMSSTTVCLADARRVSSLDESFRLVVLCWEQNGEVKKPTQLVEMLFTEDSWKNKVVGELSPEDVREFHERLSSFPSGKEGAKQARAFAKETKARLSAKKSLLTLAPKVDSKSQRRLQCTAKLEDLMGAATNHDSQGRGASGEIIYRDMSLPVVKSGPRILKGSKG